MIYPHSTRRRIALVPQDTAVPFPFTVEEIVLLGRAPHLGAFGFESEKERVRALFAPRD